MSQPGGKFVSASVTRTLVCVDATEGYEFSGRIFNPYMPRILEFHSFKEFLDRIDGFFDSIAFPQAYYTLREFDQGKKEAPRSPRSRKEPERLQDTALFDSLNGALVTFDLIVQFRQNASWQGSVVWRDRDATYEFRSTLELLKVMEDVLSKSGKPETTAAWDA